MDIFYFILFYFEAWIADSFAYYVFYFYLFFKEIHVNVNRTSSDGQEAPAHF